MGFSSGTPTTCRGSDVWAYTNEQITNHFHPSFLAYLAKKFPPTKANMNQIRQELVKISILFIFTLWMCVWNWLHYSEIKGMMIRYRDRCLEWISIVFYSFYNRSCILSSADPSLFDNPYLFENIFKHKLKWDLIWIKLNKKVW